MSRTKLVCTLGPASADRVPELVAAGMDVARINLSHGDEDQWRRTFAAVREAAERAGRTVAVLADLSGPKVRLGEIAGGEVRLEAGRPFALRPDGGPGDASGAATTYPGLGGDLEPGDRVFLADGAVELRVLQGGEALRTEVVRGGTIRSRAGLNAPSEHLSLPAITQKDRRDAELVRELGADLVAQSFVRSAADVRELRQLLREGTPVIAKIETRAAVSDAEAILAEAEGVMVARGDLGVEIPFEEIPVIQKQLIARAVAAGVPAIVATQMLESMTASPRPTRAEASDVANAVLEGADALLLSAETAIGRYPVEAVRAATRIAEVAEGSGIALPRSPGRDTLEAGRTGIARAAVELTRSRPELAAIACFTRTGRTAEILSSHGPAVPVFAFCPDEAVARRLAVRRSVLPLHAPYPTDTDAMLAAMRTRLAADGLVPGGALVVMVASPAPGSPPDLLKIQRVGSPA